MAIDSTEGDAESVIVLELETGHRLKLDERELRAALDRNAA